MATFIFAVPFERCSTLVILDNLIFHPLKFAYSRVMMTLYFTRNGSRKKGNGTNFSWSSVCLTLCIVAKRYMYRPTLLQKCLNRWIVGSDPPRNTILQLSTHASTHTPQILTPKILTFDLFTIACSVNHVTTLFVLRRESIWRCMMLGVRSSAISLCDICASCIIVHGSLVHCLSFRWCCSVHYWCFIYLPTYRLIRLRVFHYAPVVTWWGIFVIS